MREADITVEYLTKKLRACSKEDIISALVKTDFITADRVASYCAYRRLEREQEKENKRADEFGKNINEYNALVKELKQVGIDKFPLEKLEKMQKLLKEIRKVQKEQKMKTEQIKDGEHFTYKGIEFVRLGKEQGGILCVTAKIWKRLAFDKNGCNNFKKASICKALNNEFRPLLDDNDLLTYKMDLTADNGDKAYGEFCVHIGLLSADLYRKYRDYIPKYDSWVWLSTPWYCSGLANIVRLVYAGGMLDGYLASDAYGVVPACIFKECKI